MPVALREWMVFVDGENFTARGQEIAKNSGVELRDGAHHKRDVFLWLPSQTGDSDGWCWGFRFLAKIGAIRAHYYTSAIGDDQALAAIRESLRALRFDPHVFKRDPNRNRSKGVDIALTKDMLSHAFLDNYEVAVLVAGDGDYLPLVEEVKRLGKIVCVAFFAGEGSGLNDSLKLAADHFLALNDVLRTCWSIQGR